ncbi:hypothetical protein EVAR_48454_1 [Eumeta japonica]|uniref:Uncharacterized protein n=1 Tax=Eumeta variegata TaxID=151549 RepID=A0A4C1ZY49_EUMVA|nr:hypothetical protein EVAR_48454_1 [Eumeta japonica]
MATELSGFLSGGIGVYLSVLSALATAQNALWDGLISSMRLLQLSFRIPERELSLRVGELALWICTREWDMRSRGAKLRFCSYQFENIGKLPAIRGCRNLPLALLDHCPDVVD